MKWIARLFWIVGGIVVILSLAMGILLLQVADRHDSVPRLIEIERGETAREVAEKLYRQKLIQSRAGFLWAAQLLGVGTKLQAGKYALLPTMSLFEILSTIQKGETALDLAVVTFPEGQSIYRMSQTLGKAGIQSASDFERLVAEPIDLLLKSRFPFLAAIPNNSLEGYLFPDTYKLERTISATALAELMLERFAELVLPLWESQKNTTSLSFHAVLTLASIVEKEAQTPSERPLIASVYLNRLKIGMKLDADPTVKYALTAPHKVVRYQDLRVRSPYNTYLNLGLPPGPICNPSLESIRAVLEPATTPFLYFVATPDGRHLFSKTFEEHQAAKSKAAK